MREQIHLFVLISTFSIMSLLLISNSVTSTSLPKKPLKRILVLYSYDNLLPGQEMIEKDIRSVALSDPTFEIELFHEYPRWQKKISRRRCSLAIVSS